ncbi:hypothetical protein NDU88_002137 [Pleurodeles waltl]|uniref:Uncharacterized protein n=1 Tax=Pleurodeles waltl TaxID=8319 RepID=A0AAV7MUT0_PLEWA|nr:hypothetical protein NDU88_002137 [Pleurodeles waltl]
MNNNRVHTSGHKKKCIAVLADPVCSSRDGKAHVTSCGKQCVTGYREAARRPETTAHCRRVSQRRPQDLRRLGRGAGSRHPCGAREESAWSSCATTTEEGREGGVSEAEAKVKGPELREGLGALWLGPCGWYETIGAALLPGGHGPLWSTQEQSSIYRRAWSAGGM